jgi:S-adenosylmethionine synthetase
LAEVLVASVAEIAAVQCLVASRIGSPIATPALLQVKVATRDGCPVESLRKRVEEVATGCLNGLPKLVDRFLAGTINVY